jgi:hypothetical protein
MQSAGGGISGTASRDQLIKFLSKQKNFSGQLVPLNAAAPDEALAEAKQKGCEFVITTNLVEDHTDTAYQPGMGGTTTSMPKFFVTTAYKLNRVSDGSGLGEGTFKAQDTGSQQNAVGFTMKNMSGKIADAIKKAGVPAAK